jgi:hypothetical protein
MPDLADRGTSSRNGFRTHAVSVILLSMVTVPTGTQTPGPGGVTVAQCISGPADLEEWICSLFEPLPGLLTGADGHRGSWLLAITSPCPDSCVISATAWDSIENYLPHEAQCFAQISRSADRRRFARLSPARRYDLPALPGSDFHATILARVAADYPGARVDGASVRGLRWSAPQPALLRGNFAGSAPAGHAGPAFDG